MVRNVNVPCPDPPKDAHKASNKWESRTYTIDLVTPLFGGGSTPGQNDPVTLIRVPSIRGQLRFWWRATRGASCTTVKELRDREGEIWGTAESPSPVVIKVHDVRSCSCKAWSSYRQEADRAICGMLDLVTRDSMKSAEPPVLCISASFDLSVSWPADKNLGKDVEAALWAWVNFGGLGARTRRGFGSLFCEDLSPSNVEPKSIQQWYHRRLEQYAVQLSYHILPWPTVPEKPLVLVGNGGREPRVSKPISAWADSLRVLNEFRQKTGIARKRNDDNSAGRSYWPEADSLRRITGQSIPLHKRPTTINRNAFPRAELGLPIVFHFKDGPRKGEEPSPIRDPESCQLLPLGSKRMASPLILKPLALARDSAVPMILLLRSLPLTGVRIVFGHESKEFGPDAIRGSDLADYQNSPMKDRSTGGSALEAFMKFAGERGFK